MILETISNIIYNVNYSEIFNKGYDYILDDEKKTNKFYEIVNPPKYTTIYFEKYDSDTYPVVMIDIIFTKKIQIKQ